MSADLNTSPTTTRDVRHNTVSVDVSPPVLGHPHLNVTIPATHTRFSARSSSKKYRMQAQTWIVASCSVERLTYHHRSLDTSLVGVTVSGVLSFLMWIFVTYGLERRHTERQRDRETERGEL